MKRRIRIILVVPALVLAACGSTPSTTGQSSTSTTPVVVATTAPAAATAPSTETTLATSAAIATAATESSTSASTSNTAGKAVMETLHVVVSGGPHAGTYDKSATDGGCSYGLTGADSFGNQYSDDKDTTLSSVQMIAPSTKEAAKGTSKFNVTFTFGGLVDPNATNYVVETREGEDAKGSGTLTIDDRNTTATIKLNAQPQPDVKIDATIQCNQVLRNNATAAPMDSNNDEATTTGEDATESPDMTSTP